MDDDGSIEPLCTLFTVSVRIIVELPSRVYIQSWRNCGPNICPVQNASKWDIVFVNATAATMSYCLHCKKCQKGTSMHHPSSIIY